MSKQDRQGVRTPAALEQKYNFGKSFAEVMGIATDAQKAVASLEKEFGEALTSEEIFNLLTNNGESQGLYRGDDGELYINATYIKSGEFVADLIKTGILQSKDGTTFKLDLDKGTLNMNATAFTVGGKSVDDIATEIAKDKAADAVSAQTQEDIFNKLTKNGALKGIYIENGELYINATYVMSGLLAADRINVEDLFAKNIRSTGGIYTLSSKMFYHQNYTEDSLTLIQSYINGTATLTDDQINLYDVNCDGKVDSADYAQIYFMRVSEYDLQVEWECRITPDDAVTTFCIVRRITEILADGTNRSAGEEIVFAVGAGRTRLRNAEVIGGMEVYGDAKFGGGVNASGTVHADGGLTAGNGWTVMHRGNSGVGLLGLPDNLTASSPTATVSYPVGTVGFHVYGYTVSGSAIAGIFVPLELCNGNSFQFADEGNFVSFTMTADTSARTITITRTGGAGWISSVHPLYFGETL